MTVPWLQPEQYEAVLGALALLVILAMLLERALAVIFEWSCLQGSEWALGSVVGTGKGTTSMGGTDRTRASMCGHPLRVWNATFKNLSRDLGSQLLLPRVGNEK